MSWSRGVVYHDGNMSADELERFTFWHQPESWYYQTLNKKKITSSLLFGDGM